MKIEKLVVTRHKALYDYLVNNKLVPKGTKQISHADIKDIEDKHIYGVLPNWLACHAHKITELQLRIPLSKRGDELKEEEISFYLVRPRTYIITEVQEDE